MKKFWSYVDKYSPIVLGLIVLSPLIMGVFMAPMIAISILCAIATFAAGILVCENYANDNRRTDTLPALFDINGVKYYQSLEYVVDDDGNTVWSLKYTDDDGNFMLGMEKTFTDMNLSRLIKNVTLYFESRGLNCS